jgi:hypothetical protein
MSIASIHFSNAQSTVGNKQPNEFVNNKIYPIQNAANV